VEVRGLKLSDKAQTKAMHLGAEEKQKMYACKVWVKKVMTETEIAAALNPHTDLIIQQKTPVRVLHRRSLLTRPRVVHELRCEQVETDEEKDGGSTLFTLHLRTSAGTYVKEFVHGDLGRTNPSLGNLLGGVECDILELDVTDVLLGDEKEEEEEEEERKEEVNGL
jgi:tRNA pseudouridine synthase 10